MVTSIRTCPRCSSSDNYRKLIQTKGQGFSLLPGIGTGVSGVTLWVHVCGRCGHVEFSVPREHLAEIKEKFEPAPF